MSIVSVIGMPGLYQHWLQYSLDPSLVAHQDGANFFVGFNLEKTRWLYKYNDDYQNQLTDEVICTYVEDKNFVWYLYNYFEKTDHVNIKVNNLFADLKKLHKRSEAFREFFPRFVQTYNLSLNEDNEYINNAMIEYLSFILLDKESKFKTIAGNTVNGAVNIEYQDFRDSNILAEKLSTISTFDYNHFIHCYKKLELTNKDFLQRSSKFLTKIKNKSPLDVLETAFVGYILSNLGHNIDWFDSEYRAAMMNDYYNDICNFAQSIV
jgi:hypothetical protein